MQKLWIALGTFIVMVGIVWVLAGAHVAKAPSGGEACTAEAKLCPDGSYVGRTGPNCEFAECPTPSATSTLAIGESATISGSTIKVLSLVGDSRCPVDVQCIQAGTVRVNISVNASASGVTLTLGKPQVVENVTITLVSVIPAEKHSKETVAPGDYRFTFTVVSKTPAPEPAPDNIPSMNSGVRGTISLGPTCPVMREPPDPACADKPYATAIVAYREGVSTPYLIGNSDSTGKFSLPLPTGKFTLQAGGPSSLPRCAPVTVSVIKNAWTTMNISCDTGIR